jgi:hypothetical protein
MQAKPEQPEGHFPHWLAMPPVVVLPEFCRVAEQARALYESSADEWEIVRELLHEHNHTEEAAQALRAVALVATIMAESLEENQTNYGIQR